MDPITATIVGGVLWFFLGSLGTVIIWFAVFGIALLIILATDKEWVTALAIPVGWILAVAWEIFVVVHVIIQAVDLVQLLTK